ncbi:MAG: hypothetical protein ACFFG0_20785 [Candidatus Thorarchaeota archaeon]
MVRIHYFEGVRSGIVNTRDVNDMIYNANDIVKKFKVRYDFEGYGTPMKWDIWRYENGKRIDDMHILKRTTNSTVILFFLGISIINTFEFKLNYNRDINFNPSRISEKQLREMVSLVNKKMRQKKSKTVFNIKRQERNKKWIFKENGSVLLSNATSKDVYIYLIGMLTVL